MAKRACVRDEASEYLPGFYVVARDELAVTVDKSKETSTLQTLARGSIVQVLEVAKMPKEDRVRGRIAAGWISLQRTDGMKIEFVTRRNVTSSGCGLSQALRQCQFLTEVFVGSTNQPGLLSSPYDWLPLCVLAKEFRQLKVKEGPLHTLTIRFREHVKSWSDADISNIASKSDPTDSDVDLLVFCLKLKGFGRRRGDPAYKYPRATANASICEQGCAMFAKMLPLERFDMLKMLVIWGIDNVALERFIAVGGIEAVLRAMEDFPDCAQIPENGCQILAACGDSFHHFDDAEEQLRHRCVFAITSAMEEHPGVARVQELGCRAMRWRGNLDFASAGGIQATLRAMKGHPNHAGLQEVACDLLERWVQSVYSTIEEADASRNCDQIVASGGIELICTSIERHPSSRNVRKEACQCLLSMLKICPANVKLKVAPNLHLLVDAMDTYDSRAIRVLEFLSACPDIATLFGDSDVKAILQHVQSYGDGSTAIQTLANLSRMPHLATFIGNSGGFKKIVGAMENAVRNMSRFDATVLEFGCLALCRVLEKEGQSSIRALRVVLDAMSKHPESAAVQCSGLAFVEKWCGSYASTVRLGTLGGCKTVVAACEQHVEDVTVLTQGLRTLITIAKREAEKADIAALDITKIVVESMEHHSESQDVQRLGRDLLRDLCACSKAKAQSLSLRAISFFL